MLHGPVIAKPFRLAAERDLHPVAEGPQGGDLVEPNALKAPPFGVRDHRAGDALAVLQLLAVELDDLAEDGLQHARLDLMEGAEVAEVFVAAWEMGEQVGEGGDAELGEPFAASRSDASKKLDAALQFR